MADDSVIRKLSMTCSNNKKFVLLCFKKAFVQNSSLKRKLQLWKKKLCFLYFNFLNLRTWMIDWLLNFEKIRFRVKSLYMYMYIVYTCIWINTFIATTQKKPWKLNCVTFNFVALKLDVYIYIYIYMYNMGMHTSTYLYDPLRN